MARFMPLYADMLGRKGFRDTSGIDALPALCGGATDALKPHIFLVREGDMDIAGAVVARRGDTAMYLFGATRSKALALDAGYRLQWHIVDWLKVHAPACRWYDLGGDCGNEGLRQFKTGLVGRHGRTAPLPGSFEASPAWGTGIAVRCALRARDILGGLRPRFRNLAAGD